MMLRPTPAGLPDELRRNTRLNVASIDGTVLAPIVAHAIERAQALPAATPAALAEAVSLRPGRRTERPFERALSAPGARMILEVKSASPSRGLMQEHVDVEATAAVLDRLADAVSVLTEPRYFGGSFERLARLRRLTARPVLAKDFIVSPEQLLAAARTGADAVLLMLSVLSDEGFRELAALAGRLGLEVLCEASSPEELRRAARLGVRIVGLNNRDLRTLRVDRSRAPMLAGLPEAKAFPVLVAESGYDAMASVRAARRTAPGIAAFLCGSALSLAADLSTGARRLLFGQTKVCGITRTEDALAAADAGATAVGIILTPRSDRHVPPGAAAGLIRSIRNASGTRRLPLEIRVVADAPREPSALPAFLGEAGRLADAVQLHGPADRFTAAYLRAAGEGLSRIVPAFGIGSMEGALAAREALRRLRQEGLAGQAVLDAASPSGLSGGTGRTIEPGLLPVFRNVPGLVLAGGLSPETIPAALDAAVDAGIPLLGLDLNSGVELRPGVKSPERLRAAFSAIRGIPN